MGLIVAHLILVFYHKHTQFAGPRTATTRTSSACR